MLAKARPTKASSIEARQYSGAGTKREYTHALQGTRREGGNSKTKRTSFLLLAIIAAAASRRQRQDAVLEGGSSMRTRMKQSTNLHMFGNYNIKATM